MNLILASQSPRRRELLRQCGVSFTVETVEVTELTTAGDIADLPVINARMKAAAVADRHPEAWVLGADTMIIFDGQAVGKPQDMADAARMLKMFSGRSHQVVTGVALICRGAGEERVWSGISTVEFKKLAQEDIERYLSLVPVLDKAGAYAIQEYPELIIESYSGELANIIGLPVKELTRQLNTLIKK